MASQSAQFDLSTAFLDQPKTIAYGLVRGAGNLILQQELADKSRVSFYMLGEGPWDSILRLWINNNLVSLPNTATVHFHPGGDGEIGYGLSPVSTGGDQHVDQFFTLIPGGLDPITFSRFAWLALKTAPDPSAPSAQLTVLADYQAMKVRQFDSSGNQTAFAWTQNWAWIICDYLIRKFILREGKANQPLVAAELARFDWASFAAAATYFDAVIPSQQATDSFFRANANPIGGQSVTVPGCNAMQILSNMAQGTVVGGVRNAAYATSAPWKADGYSEITIGALGSSADYVGATYRAGLGASENQYAALALGPLGATAQLLIYRYVAGAPTNLASGTFTVNAGDLLRLECSGTNLTLKLNGVVKLTATDSALTSGSPGIYAMATSGALNLATIAGWSAGSFVKRFSDGGVVYANDTQNASNVLEQMLMLCRSYLLERNGKLSLYVDQPRSSVFTFTSDNIAPLSFKASKTTLRAATNRFVATYRDSDIALGSTDDATRFAISSLPVDHEAHQRAVGARGPGLSIIPKVTELAVDLGVNTSERAWRILGSQLLRQLGPDVDANTPYNAPFSAEWTGFEDSAAVEPGDIVTIDPSISEEFGGKQIEVLETDENPDGTRGIIGLEYMPNSFLDVAPVQQTLEAPLPGTGVPVPAGPGNFSYRPTSNPLTATDNGSNPLVTIAAFAMRVSGMNDVSLNGGTASASSGDYGKTAFIFYDDIGFAGGTPAGGYQITFTRETALSGASRFFVGSISLPQSGAGATVGNNDGGAGGQYAKTLRLQPTVSTLTGAWTNPGGAIDNDASTFASASSTTANIIYLATVFPSFVNWFTSVVLQVISQITAVSGGSVLIEYSTNAGGSWQTLRSVSTPDSVPVTSQVNLSLSTPTQNIQVRITLPGSTGGTQANVSAYAGTGADDASSGTLVWINPTNAQGNQSAVFASSIDGTANILAYSHYLKLTNFGFAVPSGATINGIQATILRSSNFVDDGMGNDRYINDNVIRLYKAGVLSGSNYGSYAANWPTTKATATYGGSSDLWGTTWTYSDVNNANFGIGIQAMLENDGTYNNAIARVYSLQITVYYTTSGGGAASAASKVFDIALVVTT